MTEKSLPDPESVQIGDGTGASNFDHLFYTLMKIEDTFPFDDEPWWIGVDEPTDTEVKVMFNDAMFWATPADPEFKARRSENQLVPRHGYSATQMFTKNAASLVGSKRYKLIKADGSITPISISILLGHVSPLMRYTQNFKLNVDKQGLDMPTRQMFSIVTADKGLGQEFNYSVDRFTNMWAIILLAAKPDGLYCAHGFLLMKLVSWLNQLYTAYISGSREAEASTKFQIFLFAALGNVDVCTLMLQCLTLTLLCWGLLNWVPGPLVGLLGIVVCSGTMVYMNMQTFRREVVKVLQEWQSSFTAASRSLATLQDAAINWLAGENMLNIQFVVIEKNERKAVAAVSTITLVVPELGLSFTGSPDIDTENSSAAEVAEMQLSKKVAFYTIPAGSDDTRIKSIRNHVRFERDIRPSFTVAIDTAQLMIHKPISDIVATIQCVNHVRSAGRSVSRPQFDTYLTLFKPDDWVSGVDDEDKGRVEEMLEGWKDQINGWLKVSAGAVSSERTSTDAIVEHLVKLLKKETRGSGERDAVMVEINTVRIPLQNESFAFLENQIAYATLVYDIEAVTQTNHFNRSTAYSKFRKETNDMVVEFPNPIVLEVPIHVSKFRVAIWRLTPNTQTEELVAFTSECDIYEVRSACIIETTKKTEIRPHETRLHTQWELKGLKRLDPFGGEVMTDEEKQREMDETVEPQNFQEKISMKVVNCVTSCCTRRKPKPSDDEIDQTRGTMMWTVRNLNEEELAEDYATVKMLDACIHDATAMDFRKLDRYQDSWIQMANVLGVKITETGLQKLRDKLQKRDVLIQNLESRSVPKEDQEKAIASFSKHIEQAEQTIKARNEILGDRKETVLQRKVSGRIVQTHHAEEESSFANNLLDRLVAYDAEQTADQKQMLHYVIVSDHLKPGKDWRPDTISPHMACVVTNSIDDIEKLLLTGVPQNKDVEFLRQLLPSSTVPETFNGRLFFKVKDGDTLFGSSEAYLYWDGNSRWCISETKGTPIPYGVDKNHTPEKLRRYYWVGDQANRPDKIDPKSSWQRWPLADEAHLPQKWMKCDDMKILFHNPMDAKKQAARSQQIQKLLQHVVNDDDEEEEEQDMITSAIKNLLEEFKELAQLDSARKADPEMKECLVSMNSEFITFTWRDDHIMRLAGFRRFLLGEYGTYQRAWLDWTRNLQMKIEDCEENLLAMLKLTKTNLENGKWEDPRSKDEDANQATKDAMEKELKSNLTSKSTVSSPGQLPRYISAEDLELLEVYCSRGEHALEAEVKEVMRLIDASGEGNVNVEELYALFDEDAQFDDRALKEFSSFVQLHPVYRFPEFMWAELSKGLEISLQEFQRDAKMLFTKYCSQDTVGKSPEEKAEILFQALDYKLSQGIALDEVIPPSGETWQDAGRSLLTHRLPVSHLAGITAMGSRTYGIDKLKALKIMCGPQFVNTSEWQDVKVALNPGLDKLKIDDTIIVAMHQEFLKMWMLVIEESGMQRARENIRWYTGPDVMHPHMKSSYMREGYGIQRWPDGRVYQGHWKHHVYDGHGKLYRSMQDLENEGSFAIYDGHWLGGKKEGKGVFRWEQTMLHENSILPTVLMKKAGSVKKLYDGHFRDDLFHGIGTMKMQRVRAQNLTGTVALQASVALPHPNMDPGQALEASGTFNSDWDQVDDKLREVDHNYRKEHPEKQKVLAIHKLTPKDMKSRTFQRYLDVDEEFHKQKSGDPMPDIALAIYRHVGEDMRHFVEGRVSYADGTNYEGLFFDGVPHGKGKTTQYDLDAQGNPKTNVVLATYQGQFENGARNGEGEYKRSWEGEKLEYKGEWKDNLRHGQGVQTVPKALWDELSHVRYEGEWNEDIRDGKGKLTYRKGDEDLVYEGDLVNNLREGTGTIRLMGDLVYNGPFVNDRVVATAEKRAWMRLSELGDTNQRFFYGEISASGTREGHGKVFVCDKTKLTKDAQAKELMAAFTKGDDFSEDSEPEIHHWKFTVYDGQWKGDKQQGDGIHHIKDQGTYRGQFVAGKRHGRGEWVTNWGAKYRPIPDPSRRNWDNDLMHGIAIVETSNHVHENIIYTKGQCHMPFVDIGPPTTGFDDAPVVGKALHLVQIGKQKVKEVVAGGATGLTAPSADLVGVSKNDMRQRIAGTVQRKAEALFVTPSATPLAMVRESTELGTPQIDMLIEGGTGVNAVMNGLYFGCSRAFGVKMFLLVKKKGENISKRYLTYDDKMWTVTETQTVNMKKPAVGTCMVEGDERGPSPGVSWYVYHPASKQYKCPDDMRSPTEDRVDHVVCTTIIGFDVIGATGRERGPLPGLMLRQSMEHHGRPVYEAETGDQYLYYFPKEAEDGEQETNNENGGEDSWLEKPGSWILAETFDEKPRGPKCFAYIEDTAVTPNEIRDGGWMVRKKDDFEPNSKLRLEIQACNVVDNLLAAFDGADGADEPLLGRR
eukprot:TRINITY_DN18978_c0_g5_i1.p1 TRINITY_DN18978_c0_g5~~TRINITY_DN18978_c0_g5_i1.p1  ORF type:complete len:2448 (-),score=375.80 TRINITY_DN18978_c0_g5_i1:62-7321(-)